MRDNLILIWHDVNLHFFLRNIGYSRYKYFTACFWAKSSLNKSKSVLLFQNRTQRVLCNCNLKYSSTIVNLKYSNHIREIKRRNIEQLPPWKILCAFSSLLLWGGWMSLVSVYNHGSSLDCSVIFCIPMRFLDLVSTVSIPDPHA